MQCNASSDSSPTVAAHHFFSHIASRISFNMIVSSHNVATRLSTTSYALPKTSIPLSVHHVTTVDLSIQVYQVTNSPTNNTNQKNTSTRQGPKAPPIDNLLHYSRLERRLLGTTSAPTPPRDSSPAPGLECLEGLE